MEEAVLTIRPMGRGWRLDLSEDAAAPQVFLSGARAEAAAHALARRLARAGASTQVVVYDRSNAVVGETRYGALVIADDPSWAVAK